jgi:Na+-translocating ferredoxin:NAD+ oxidoreductase RnfG subunit
MDVSFVNKNRKVVAFVVLAAINTVIAGTIYAAVQQTYRNAANDPQVDAVEQINALLAQGAPAEAIIGQSAPVDMVKSSSLFVIIYDKDGKVIGSSATLDKNTPSLPSGVIDYTKSHNTDRFTWQPKKGIRVAAVIRKVDNDGGYVLVGRSLGETEKRISQLTGIVGIAWIILLLLSLLFAWVLGLASGGQNITVVENTEVINVEAPGE